MKRVLAAVAVAASVLLFAACGGPKQNPPPECTGTGLECLVDTDCRYRTVCTPRVTDAGISNFCEPPRPDAGP